MTSKIKMILPDTGKLLVAVFCGSLLLLTSCLDNDFDEALAPDLPGVNSNTTIAELKSRHTIGADDQLIEEDIIIGGVVVANDRSGNFFKNIVIQDGTGGITVRLNSVGLYNTYPVGRQVSVRCQGLYLGDYNGLMQLNGSSGEEIEELLIEEHLFVGERNQPIDTSFVTIDALNENLVNRLVHLDNVQFTRADSEQPYADAANRQSLNRTIEDCNGNSVIIRSSGYADFASKPTPAGNGSVTAILSVFGDTKQLIIRELEDVQMMGGRCGTAGDTVAVNSNIQSLKARHTIGADDQKIDEEVVISGVVIADDRSGNFFKQIVIQDETAGIVVRMDAEDLYREFPVGQKVKINCQDLYVGDYNGLMQLNGSPGQSLSASQVSRHVFPGAGTQTIEPQLVTVDQLGEEHLSTLIRLEGVQFASADAGETYANAEERLSLNRTIQDCAGNELLLRSSGYADFAGDLTPEGNGSLVAVYSVFRDDQQLHLRDLNDVNMTAERCVSGVTGSEMPVSLAELRSLFQSGADQVPADRKISGIVISDKDHGNISERNLVLQDESGGMALRFSDAHRFALGEAIEVIVSGRELSEYNGLLQINDIDPARATSRAAGELPEPRGATVAEVLSNLESWESTLVALEGVTLSGNAVYEGNLSVSDATGSIALYTRGDAGFASEPVPTGAVDLVAIVSQFNDPQLALRNIEDVSGGGAGQNPFLLNESFSNQTDDQDVAMEGWVNRALEGTRRWQAKEFQGNVYVQATAYQDENPAMEAWLITPAIDLNEASTLTFDSFQAFYQHDGLTVWIATDFKGEDPKAANWTQLDCKLAGSGQENYTWVSSGDIDLSAFSGTGHIAFRYEGDSAQNTTSYAVDNVRVQ